MHDRLLLSSSSMTRNSSSGAILSSRAVSAHKRHSCRCRFHHIQHHLLTVLHHSDRHHMQHLPDPNTYVTHKRRYRWVVQPILPGKGCAHMCLCPCCLELSVCWLCCLCRMRACMGMYVCVPAIAACRCWPRLQSSGGSSSSNISCGSSCSRGAAAAAAAAAAEATAAPAHAEAQQWMSSADGTEQPL